MGNTNPTGVEVRKDSLENVKKDTVPFTPYYAIKDLFAIVVLLILFAIFVFFAPNYLGHPDNYIPANPLVTPEHIVPEWYFLPFYAILRSIDFNILFIPGKLAGVLAMFGAIAILAFAPWLDTSRVRSTRYRPIYRWWFWLLVIDFFVLMWVGSQTPTPLVKAIGLIGTLYWFAHFLIVMPVVGLTEKPLPQPETIEAAFKEKYADKGEGSEPPPRNRPNERGTKRMKTMLKNALAATALSIGAAASAPAMAAGGETHMLHNHWHFSGPFGTFEPAELQRGLQVYREVCQACHGMKYVAFRTLSAETGPGLSEAQVKAIAAEYDVPDEEGEPGDTRAGKPFDYFPTPIAVGNPPDFSLLAKARPGGPDHIYSVLLSYTGEEKTEAGATLYENAAFPGGWIGMGPPLSDGLVEYADGSPQTVEQYSNDVSAFLMWGGGAEDDGTQAGGHPQRVVPRHLRGAAVVHQQEDLAQGQASRGVSQDGSTTEKAAFRPLFLRHLRQPVPERVPAHRRHQQRAAHSRAARKARRRDRGEHVEPLRRSGHGLGDDLARQRPHRHALPGIAARRDRAILQPAHVGQAVQVMARVPPQA